MGVDGSQLRVFGQARLPLVIGTATISTSVVVVDAMTTEGILGMDFLRQHQCTIDIPCNCLLLANQGIKVPLQGHVKKLWTSMHNSAYNCDFKILIAPLNSLGTLEIYHVIKTAN